MFGALIDRARLNLQNSLSPIAQRSRHKGSEIVMTASVSHRPIAGPTKQRLYVLQPPHEVPYIGQIWIKSGTCEGRLELKPVFSGCR